MLPRHPYLELTELVRVRESGLARDVRVSKEEGSKRILDTEDLLSPLLKDKRYRCSQGKPKLDLIKWVVNQKQAFLEKKAITSPCVLSGSVMSESLKSYKL